MPWNSRAGAKLAALHNRPSMNPIIPMAQKAELAVPCPKLGKSQRVEQGAGCSAQQSVSKQHNPSKKEPRDE